MAWNTELANMKPLVLGEIQATDHIFVNWSVYIFVSCVFLNKYGNNNNNINNNNNNMVNKTPYLTYF